MLHEPKNLEVLYEDNHLIAVVKPAGLLVQSDHTGAFCLLETVRQYLREQYDKPGDAFVGLLHRLDRPVAGVVLFAKTSKGASRLSEQIRERTIKKTYHALVEGTPASEGVLVHYTKEGEVGQPVVLRDAPGPELKRAELAYRLLRSGNRGFSLVEIDLRTGRKHQIRAQMGRLGHPLAGDAKYGATKPFPSDVIGLVAYSLEFTHPIRKEERITVALPVRPEGKWAEWLA